MKKWWARLCCLLLALMLLVSIALPALATEDEDEGAKEDTTKDYVILLDCSLSTSFYDTENLCLEACWDFLDKLPLYDTRVSIFAFGYESEESNGYQDWSSFDVKSKQDIALIHELVPLSELTSSEDREAYKLLMQRALEEYRYESEKTFTPYTHALAAAVDMLEKNTDPADSRNACIILITDGVLDDREYYNKDDPNKASAEAERLLTEASERAGQHDWPIYSLQLDYDNPYEIEREWATRRLAQISANGGKNSVGSIACKTDFEVFEALMRIYADFNNLSYTSEPPRPLPLTERFEVKPLTSEISIDVYGEGISSISLYQVDADGRRKAYKENITTDLEQRDLMVSVSEKYCSVKMIVPEEGQWEIYVDGVGGAQVLFNLTPIYEMRLHMTQNPDAQTVLTKNDEIRVDALFTYHGIDEDNSDIYTKMPAVLKVYDLNNRTIKTVESTDTEHYHADKTGYHFTLPLNWFPAEKGLRFQVVVEDGMFRDGIKYSDIGHVKFDDMPTTLVDSAEARSLQAHVGGEFQLDLRQIFNNPDNDPLVYVLTCRNDATASFTYEMDKDQMIIPAGMKPGTYEMSIAVKGEDVVYDQLTLTVINDLPYLDVKKIEDIELWSDCYGFQESNDTATLDLNACFKDPEGMTLTYTLQFSDGSVVDVTTSDSGVLTASTIEGVEGETTVTVTAADGITADSVATASFEISVVSGKMVFWRENWIYFAIAAVILLAIVIVIMVILKNKLVKGHWMISVDDCGATELINDPIDIAGYTYVGKKSKFKLMDLMNELAVYLPNGWGLKITNYFSVPGADKLMLCGVTQRKGCKVKNIPAEHQNVIVNVNGMDVTRSNVSVYSGTLTVVLKKDDGTGDQMTITMTLQ